MEKLVIDIGRPNLVVEKYESVELVVSNSDDSYTHKFRINHHLKAT